MEAKKPLRVTNHPATAVAGKGLRRATHLTLRVTHQLHFAELAAHGVVHDDFSRRRAAVAGQQLYRFHRL